VVKASAPGRINLIGEHIDYNHGWVLPFAIKYRTYVEISRKSDPIISIYSQELDQRVEISLDQIEPEKRRRDWSDYVIGTIWSLGVDTLLKENNSKDENGLDIKIRSEVPLGAGLSSSAALECAVAVALNQLFDLKLSLMELAQLTQRAENLYVGVPTGIMDQSISLMAHEGSALLIDCLDLSTTHIPFDLEAAGLELLIIDTNVHHELTDGGYSERRRDCEMALAQLGFSSMRQLDLSQLELFKKSLTEIFYIRLRHVLSEIARVHHCVAALKAGDFTRVGELIYQSHCSLRDDYQVSSPELNLAVDVAMAHGALGARMVGGGFGGSAIALIEIEKIEGLKSKIEGNFKEKDFIAPRFFTSKPSQGAALEL
jgi:galactokinase